MKLLFILLVTLLSINVFSQEMDYQDLVRALGYHPYPYDNILLSDDERYALTNYTHYDEPIYQDINGYLRGTLDDFWFYRDTKEIDEDVFLIDSVINKLKDLPKDLILFRGMSLGFRNGKFFNIGEIFIDKAYLSSSTSRMIGDSFSISKKNSVTLILYSSQKRFKGIAVNEIEDEVLLPRNTILKIMEEKKKGTKQIVIAQICEEEKVCEEKINNFYIEDVFTSF